MSHLNEFETEMDDQEALLRALCRVGFTRDQIEVHDRACSMVGYHGTEDNKVGHIIIRKNNSRIPSDIGWEKKDETYVAHVDNFDYTNPAWIGRGGGPGAPIYNDRWHINLLNFYNLEKAKLGYEAKGLTCIETKDEKGRLQLRAKFHVTSEASKIKTRS